MKKIIFISIISLFSIFLSGHFVVAAECAPTGACLGDCVSGYHEDSSLTCEQRTPPDKCCVRDVQINTTNGNKGFGFDTVDKVASDSGYNSGTEVGLEKRISNVIGIFLSLLGVLFMILMIYGGYNWMTAAGDEQKIDKAKDTIRAAVIGLIIVIAAYAVSVFIITRLWGVDTPAITN